MTAELHAQTGVSLLHQAYSDLKGLSVIINSKIHFFPNPPIFFFFFFLPIQRELHCNSLPIQQFSRNSIFLERETILCC